MEKRLSFSLHFLLGNSLGMNNPHAIANTLLVDILAYFFHIQSPPGRKIWRSPIFNSKMVPSWSFSTSQTTQKNSSFDQLFLILLIMVHISSTIFYHMVEWLYISPISKSELLPAPIQLNLK